MCKHRLAIPSLDQLWRRSVHILYGLWHYPPSTNVTPFSDCILSASAISLWVLSQLPPSVSLKAVNGVLHDHGHSYFAKELVQTLHKLQAICLLYTSADAGPISWEMELTVNQPSLPYFPVTFSTLTYCTQAKLRTVHRGLRQTMLAHWGHFQCSLPDSHCPTPENGIFLVMHVYHS